MYASLVIELLSLHRLSGVESLERSRWVLLDLWVSAQLNASLGRVTLICT